jgi:hypothetical protein
MSRAALDDEAERIELTVRLRQKRRRKPDLLDRLAKPPDRGVIGRLRLQRQSAEAPERQRIPNRLLRAWVRERAPLLQKNDLEQRQRRVAGRASDRRMGWGQRRCERRPVDPLLDPVQKSSNLPISAHYRIDERRLGQVTARRRRIILSGLTSENQIRPTSAKLSVVRAVPRAPLSKSNSL